MIKPILRFIVPFLFAALSHAAFAIDKVDSPNVNEGELDLEYSGNRTFDSSKSRNDIQDTQTMINYGVTDRWEFDVGGIYSKQPDQSFLTDGVQMQNIFQFFEKGSHWVDSGVAIAFNGSSHADLPDSAQIKFLLEKNAGKWIHDFNLGLEQSFGPHSGGGGPDRTLEWSTSYNFGDGFQPGFEIQSDLGQPNEGFGYNREQNYIGPAVYGTLYDQFHYEFAYLAGISSASSDSAVRFLFQYQVHF